MKTTVNGKETLMTKMEMAELYANKYGFGKQNLWFKLWYTQIQMVIVQLSFLT